MIFFDRHEYNASNKLVLTTPYTIRPSNVYYCTDRNYRWFCEQENRRRQKEEEEVRKQRERAQKMAEFEKWKNPPKANFVISKRATAEGGDVCIDASVIAFSADVTKGGP